MRKLDGGRRKSSEHKDEAWNSLMGRSKGKKGHKGLNSRRLMGHWKRTESQFKVTEEKEKKKKRNTG